MSLSLRQAILQPTQANGKSFYSALPMSNQALVRFWLGVFTFNLFGMFKNSLTQALN